MKIPLYRKALAHSWHLAIRHTWLWPFGLFAAVLGQLGMFEMLSKAFLKTSTAPLFPPLFSRGPLDTSSFAHLSFDTWISIIWLLVLLTALAAAIVYIAVVSQTMLVDIAARSTKQKKFSDTDESWHRAVGYFWPVLTIQIIKKLSIAISVAFVGWASVNILVMTRVFDVFLFFFVFVLAVLVGLVISFLAIYAIGYVVVEEYTFGDAIHAAWTLFVDHWLVSLEVGLLMIGANILLFFIVIFGMFIFMLPAIVLWFVALVFGSYALLVLGFSMGVLLAMLFVFLAGSLFSVFNTSVWTYLFMAMHKKEVKSRIVHTLS
jgi:hypothetical protein